MNLIQAIEIFAFATGIAYVILEILQKNTMWIVGILTGAACAYSFAVQSLYASMGLNIYYVIVSFIGLYQWKKASATVSDGAIHLAVLPKKTIWISAAVFVLGSAALIALLHLIGDSESGMDAIVTVLSAIGTWWLAKSYPQQWLIWIVADILSTVLCLISGLYWMGGLYLVYAASAVYGYIHWRRHGEYIG